jgi:metallo-beta-lactamase class B
VFAASTSINPGTRFVGRPSYPGIAEDFARSFRFLESLTPDVFLGAHAQFFRMQEKRARLGAGGPNPFVDPQLYKDHVADKKRTFLAQLARERGEAR